MSTMEKKLKAEILVVDDHGLVLEGLCRLVANIPEVVVVDAVTSGEEASKLIAERDYDIYILDVELPDVSGFDLITQIRELNENARIIVNTMHEEVWIVNRLAQSGVNAIVLKNSTVSELVNAIRSILQGESYTCARFTAIYEKLQRSSFEILPKRIPTRRERDVLQAVAKGMNTLEIAKLLNISENTVETFRKRLINKLEAKNAVDMVMKALLQGLIDVV